MSQPKRVNTETTKASASKPRRSFRKDASNLFKDGLNWDKYLQLCNLPAAPQDCFKQSQDGELLNKFEINHKVEAQDPRSPTSICLATVVALQGPRIKIRLDGGDTCNDFWRLVDAGDIYPLGTHESEGKLLQPPLGYTKNMSTWSSFLAKNREKGEKADQECFLPEPPTPEKNLFELGMKLEAIDRKNPDLICPATIGDIDNEKVLISFDGWRGAMDYSCHFSSRELFPIGWCTVNNHPLTNPGTKGDNPAVVERLKQLADMSKRQTRSGAITDAEKVSRKSPDITISIKADSNLVKSGRSRGRPRPIRSLAAQGIKPSSPQKVTPGTEELLKARLPVANISSVPDISADSETCDSSISSHQSTESSSSDEESDTETKNEEKVDSVEKMEEEKDENIVEIKTDTSEKMEEISETEQERHERKMKKRKKNKKKLKKLYQYEESVMLERKRYASLGDEEHFAVRSKKRKKNKRKHSMSSSLNESPRKRMSGFGTQTSAKFRSFGSSNIQSPSFLDNAASPTSLFGFTRDEIVKKATEGWPFRLMGSSKMVVTSDNKLGKFGPGNSIAESSCQTNENAQVTTTTQEIGEFSNRETDPMSQESSKMLKISSQTVSSTTNPPQNLPQKMEIANISQNGAQSSTPKHRSRNPQRWSVSEVMDYIRESEPALKSHVHLFQIHEIDGQALLLLNSTLAVKYMNMKLGPALKLSNMIEQLKELVPPPRSAPR